MRFLLDTDTISFALRGQGSVAAELRRRSPSEICTSSIVMGELELGVVRRGARKLRRELDALCSGLEVLAYDVEAARRYGQLAAKLIDEGSPIGVEDAMVAAHAMSRGLTLVTHNLRHFERVRGLRLVDWYERPSREAPRRSRRRDRGSVRR